MSLETQVSTEDLATITNEFGYVTVRLVKTPKGERLEIEAPKLGRSIRLDAVNLETLTWQDEEVFTEFLIDDMNSSFSASEADEPEQSE